MTEIDVALGHPSEEELRRRVRELAAVYRMADAAASAETLHDVLEVAVEVLVGSVGADRAAVLLRDERGTMRFRAWRGLSEDYRAAVDGHSPWRGDEGAYEPIVVADVRDDPSIDAPLRRTIVREGIRGLAFVPLVHRGELLGKFMLYADAPRDWSGSDLRLAQTIASTIAGATKRAQAEQALRDSQRQLDVVLQRVADGITVQLPDGRLVFANDAAASLIGYPSAEELLAAPLEAMLGRFELLDEEGDPLPLEDLPGRRALLGETAERVVGYRIRATGEERWSIVTATPIFAPDGGIESAVNVFRDITGRRREERRLEFLARAGEALARSLDMAQTLEEVARLAVPAVGDWAMVYVKDEEGAIRRIAIEHFQGRHEGLLERLEAYEFDRDAEIGIPAVIRTGRPQLYRQADSRLVASDVRDGGRLAEQLDDLGICSWMTVPLTARGRTFGAMSFLSTESRRSFDEADLGLAQDLARRAALAVDNARLYEESQRAARWAEESFALLEAILASAPVGIGFWDRNLRYVRVNETLAQINGRPVEEHIGRTLHEVIPDLAEALEPVYRGVLETGEPLLRHESSTELNSARLGTDRHWLTSYFPVKIGDGDILGVGAVITDITDRKLAEEERAARARQQADVAALGQLALSGADLDELIADAVQRLTATLGLEYAKVLELLPDGTALRLRKGVGFREGVEGTAIVGAGRDSQAGHTLRAEEPVVVTDLASETRFTGTPFLHEHGVVSGMTVVIEGRERPFGVLGVHSTVAHTFSRDDVNYLQSVANVLAAALDQADAREQERAVRERLRFLAEASRILASSLDFETTLRNVADLASGLVADWVSVILVDGDGAARRIVGRSDDPDRTRGADLAERYPPRLAGDTPVGRALRDQESLLVPVVTDEMLVAVAQDEEHLALLREAGLRSTMIVPLVAAGRVAGAITFALEGGERSFGDEDLAHAEELARRAGVAIENARLFADAEAARTQAEARAQAAQALQFVGDGVFLLDRSGIVRLWNPAAEMITGLRADEVIGRPADQAIPGWTGLVSRVPIGLAFEGPGVRPETLPVEIRERELWLSISGVGFGQGTVFAFRDVTLERGVEKLKSDFVSTISHELRTPLAAIYGAALTLRRADAPLEAGQRDDLLAVIASESERLARIVNDILWTSRIESGGLQVSIQACDPVELAAGVVQAARTSMPAGHELALDAPADMPELAADPDKVRQVLTNLVDNAVKYSPGGGRIAVSLEGTEGRVRFVVADQGLGIPAVERERIFEKFYRLDPDLARGVGGTGLGLYICRELVARMGGRIWVDPGEGGGSTFIVDLPAADDVAAHIGR